MIRRKAPVTVPDYGEFAGPVTGPPGRVRQLGLDSHQHLTSLVTEQQRTWSSRLRFADDFIEAEFRSDFNEQNQTKTRPILIAGSGLILFGLVLSMIMGDLSWAMAAFTLVVLLPFLMAALVTSYKEGAHGTYEILLSISAFLVGIASASLALRASLDGAPYYFAAEVAFIFLVWLAIGLRVGYAACVAISVSLVYVWGMFHRELPQAEVLFCGITLLVVNLIGAYCAYQLEHAVRKAFKDKRELNELAERDGLTGLYNRRRYDESIQKIWRQSRREQSQFSLIFIDIDHFKAYNDLYGHQAGDDALRLVADVIALHAQRPLDFAARFGGEEFALLLYGPANEQGRELPEELRRTVEELRIPHAESTTSAYLTVSVGVAIISPGTDRSLPGAIQIADEALYQAKEEGRNRVVVKESRNAHIQTGRFRASRLKASA